MKNKKTIRITLAWLQGMASTCLGSGIVEFDAAIVEKGGKLILATELVGNELLPKFDETENLHVKQEHESFKKAIAAGLSPVWRDEDGNFCTREDDADGAPEFYLENASSAKLIEVAKASGVPVKPGLSKDGLVMKLKKHFGFVEEDGAPVVPETSEDDDPEEPGSVDPGLDEE